MRTPPVRPAIHRSRLAALGCALTLLLCCLLSRPYLDMGMNDDFGYFHMAKELGRTGHLVYNGYPTAMLGWMLFVAEALIHLFGFSFTVLRFETIGVAMATAFLTHRSALRAGLNQWNATTLTLLLVLSPLFLPLATSFMTDMGGFFCVVLCFYACLRALQAETDRTAAAWLCFAALSNALGGTIRQIAWLGVLVMVPSTLWLLRKRRGVLLAGTAACVLSVAIIWGVMHWFLLQPYSLPESLLPAPLDRRRIVHLALVLPRFLLSAPVFLMPVLLAFVPLLRRGDRRTALRFGAGVLLCVVGAVLIGHSQKADGWLAPYGGNYVMPTGAVEGTHLHGQRPIVLGTPARLLLTVLSIGSLLSFVVMLFEPRSQQASAYPSRVHAQILLWPFTFAYLALLLPRSAFDALYDRYLLPLLFAWGLLVVLHYQDRYAARLPVTTLIAVLFFACYGTATLHDAFSLFRARTQAAAELTAAGVPPTQIDAGLEYDGWTQLETQGYVNDFRIRIPVGAYAPRPGANDPRCPLQGFDMLPAITPRYALAYAPDLCYGASSRFPPVAYDTWLTPRHANLYIVKAVPDAE